MQNHIEGRCPVAWQLRSMLLRRSVVDCVAGNWIFLKVSPIESLFYTILYINALQRGVARERKKQHHVYLARKCYIWDILVSLNNNCMWLLCKLRYTKFNVDRSQSYKYPKQCVLRLCGNQNS